MKNVYWVVSYKGVRFCQRFDSVTHARIWAADWIESSGVDFRDVLIERCEG